MSRHGELAAGPALRIQLRPARELDRPWLEDVHVAALGPVALVGYGWTAERLRRQFHREIDLASCTVISVLAGSGVRSGDAGYVSVEDRGASWYIAAFAIAPNFQRRGVGAAALRAVLDAAGALVVRLSVLRTNRARSLYLRLGFRVTGGDAVREHMEWRR